MPEQMEKALECIASGKRTIHDAAQTHGIPVTTESVAVLLMVSSQGQYHTLMQLKRRHLERF